MPLGRAIHLGQDGFAFSRRKHERPAELVYQREVATTKQVKTSPSSHGEG
jgi:hypothetical protein